MYINIENDGQRRSFQVFLDIEINVYDSTILYCTEKIDDADRETVI